MAFSICLKVTVVDKKVLAHCTNLKKRTIIVFVIMFIMLLIFSVLMFLFHIIPGITFLVLDLFILLIICLYRKLPNEVFLYNPEKEELILYGKGSLFTFSKPLIINRNDVISLGFNGKSPLNKRKTYEHFYIQTPEKIFVFRMLDDFERAYLNVLGVLPEEFFLQKFIQEGNFEKILSFKDKAFFMGFNELMYKKIYTQDLDEEQFELYIFSYFLFCLYNGGIHYFALFFIKYLDIVIEMFNKFDMEECVLALNKLHYLYPKSTGKDFYEDYTEMYSTPEDVKVLDEKLKEIITVLFNETNKKNILEIFRQYIISKNIKF